jgi:hypothetical protein
MGAVVTVRILSFLRTSLELIIVKCTDDTPARLSRHEWRATSVNPQNVRESSKRAQERKARPEPVEDHCNIAPPIVTVAHYRNVTVYLS